MSAHKIVLKTILNLIDCSIYDMQNEEDYLNHCNEFFHILDFDILS